MIEIDVIPLELATFRLPDRDPAGRQGVVIGYAVRHPDGVFLFDTGFGSGNAELDAHIPPRAAADPAGALRRGNRPPRRDGRR